MMKKPLFTVFTSTYNRKHTIHRVWDSLMSQTNKNFEWIIIDNGSEDGIKPLLEEYKSKAEFIVKTFYQKNQGKYKAFNRAVDIAQGELFFPADSDDRFEPNTVERFNEIWNKYKDDNISGIDVLCKYEDGVIVGEEFPFNEGVSCYKDIVYKHKIGGEKWGCIRVDLLRKYRFPTNFDVTNFEDDYIWAQIGFNYNTVYVNEALRTYYNDAGGQLTHVADLNVSIEFMKYKKFYTLWKINYIFPVVEKYLSYKKYFHIFVFLWLTTFRSKTSVLEIIQKLERRKSKIVALLLLTPSYIIYIFRFELKFLRKKKYRFQQPYSSN